jgi:hypothetical protein
VSPTNLSQTKGAMAVCGCCLVVVLSVVDLADDGVIDVAGERGVRTPRAVVVGGALVGWVRGCSVW